MLLMLGFISSVKFYRGEALWDGPIWLFWDADQ